MTDNSFENWNAIYDARPADRAALTWKRERRGMLTRLGDTQRKLVRSRSLASSWRAKYMHAVGALDNTRTHTKIEV